MISAVIITRNEAHNIARCLDAARTVASELIVVDAESTDDTRAIAEAHGAKVTVRKWTDYSDQKNFANNLATHSYILSLDADEELSPALITALRSEMADGLAGAYSFNRLTNYCGSWIYHGGWYPDEKVRLFPKGAAKWTGSHVHETLVLDTGITDTHVSGDLLHYSYANVADHMARIERYSDLHAQRMFAEGRRATFAKRELSPVVKFIDSYLLRMGLLDGKAGLRIARISAKAVRLKYAKLHALRHGARS